jgi:CHAD domain-containing protein
LAKAGDILGLGPSLRFRDAAARAVVVRSEEMFAQSKGVLDISDIERVHDMRVASRRLRATLEVFAPAFPKSDYKRVLRDVKALADALGSRRDPDVAIERLESATAELTPADAPGIDSLVAHLQREQTEANEDLARALDRAEKNALRERLMLLAAEARAA